MGAAVLIAARAISIAGDLYFRVAAASEAARVGRSTLLAGLVLVAPGIAGLVVRSRLFARFEIRRAVGALVLADVLRALAFCFASFADAWPVTIAVAIASGAVQPAFDGAVAAVVPRLVRSPAELGPWNVRLRVATVLASALGLGAAVATSASVAQGALVEATTFVLSALLTAVFVGGAARPPETASDRVASGAVSLSIVPAGAVYVVAAAGLAIAAPTMVFASADLLGGTPLHVAYAMYQAAVLAGNLVGAVFLARRVSQEAGALAAAVAGISAPALLLFVGNGWVLLGTALVSAAFESALVVNLQARAQASLSSTQVARYFANLRAQLALVGAAGLAVNVAVAPYFSPPHLVGAAAAVGLLLGVARVGALARGQRFVQLDPARTTHLSPSRTSN